MILSLHLRDFKNFRDETLRMGPFTVIVGANASGKSNIRDAFRFLHGIGRGYGLADIIGGRYGAGGQAQWAQIRGAADEIARFGSEWFRLGVRLRVRVPRADGRASVRRAMYVIRVAVDDRQTGEFRVIREGLQVGDTTVFTSHPGGADPVRKQDDDTHLLLRMAKGGAQRKYGHRIAVRPNQPALTQIGEHKAVLRDHKLAARAVVEVLGNMRFLDLSPGRMREPAFPGQDVLGDGGDNLPTVLKTICSDAGRRQVFVDWTRELTPMDVRDIEFPTDPITGRIQLAFREANDRLVSAYGASDGTLRFLAMLAALLGSNPASLYFFEEIDNGIHPSRLRLLVELMETQTTKGSTQVVTTTHSPELLSIVSDGTFEATSVVCRREGSHEAVIRPVPDLPNAPALRRSQGLGRLHTSGWMEDAVLFSESGAGGGDPDRRTSSSCAGQRWADGAA